MKDKLLVFQSDFGILEGTVSQMHGISVGVDPTLKIFNLTHLIPKFDTWEASYSLYQTCNAWPKETVFVSVIDPSVGSGQRCAVAKTALDHYIVTPDNGTLTHLKKHIGIVAIREIDEKINRVKGSGASPISYGRDVYAFTGARLASGVINFEKVGPEYSINLIFMHEVLDPFWDGDVLNGILHIDDLHFGTVFTNIPINYFEKIDIAFGDMVEVEIMYNGTIKYRNILPYCRTFSDVPQNSELIYNNEDECYAIASNLNSFVRKFGISTGNSWKVRFKKSKK